MDLKHALKHTLIIAIWITVMATPLYVLLKLLNAPQWIVIPVGPIVGVIIGVLYPERIFRKKLDNFTQMLIRDSNSDAQMLLESLSQPHLTPLRNALASIPNGVSPWDHMDNAAKSSGLKPEWDSIWRKMKCDSGGTGSVALWEAYLRLNNSTTDKS